MVDRTTKKAENGLKGIGEAIDREIEKWGLTKSDKKAILARITPSMDISHAEDADIVLEAIPENLDEKRRLFTQLDDLCNEDALLVTLEL